MPQPIVLLKRPAIFLLLATFLLAVSGAVSAAEPAQAKGTVEKITVHGASLEGGLGGYSTDRDVYVYLPPSYQSSRSRRYPVIYSLHGFGGTGESWVQRLEAPAAFDRAIAKGAREMVVVMPNAFTPLRGSMFSSSVTTGDWESFISQDLVAAIDAKYRTLATRRSRALSGFSMGGYGTLRIAMKRPDVFSSIYAMSSCCLPPQLPPAPEPGALDGFAALAEIKTLEQASTLGFGAAPLGMAAAWSPNPANPPLYLDLPLKDGKPNPDVIAAWSANSILVMVHQHVPALRRIDAIALEVGLQDILFADNEKLHALLDIYGIRHSYETYEGGHGDKVAQRFEQRVIPYFSERLDFSNARRSAR